MKETIDLLQEVLSEVFSADLSTTQSQNGAIREAMSPINQVQHEFSEVLDENPSVCPENPPSIVGSPFTDLFRSRCTSPFSTASNGSLDVGNKQNRNNGHLKDNWVLTDLGRKYFRSMKHFNEMQELFKRVKDEKGEALDLFSKVKVEPPETVSIADIADSIFSLK